jgi:hypothetical protein
VKTTPPCPRNSEARDSAEGISWGLLCHCQTHLEEPPKHAADLCFQGKTQIQCCSSSFHVLPAGLAACPGICPNKQDGQVLPNSGSWQVLGVGSLVHSRHPINVRSLMAGTFVSGLPGEWSCWLAPTPGSPQAWEAGDSLSVGLLRGRCGNFLPLTCLSSLTAPPYLQQKLPRGFLALWVPSEWSHSWLGWGLFLFFGRNLLFQQLPPPHQWSWRLAFSVGFPSSAPCSDLAAGILTGQVARR